MGSYKGRDFKREGNKFQAKFSHLNFINSLNLKFSHSHPFFGKIKCAEKTGNKKKKRKNIKAHLYEKRMAHTHTHTKKMVHCVRWRQ